MKVICPVVSILGDNLSQNLLCGKLENKHSSSCRMSRACLTFNCDTDNLPHVCQSFPVHLELQLTRAALGVSYGCFTPSFTSSNLEDWKQFQPPGGFNRPDVIALRKFREKIADSLLKSVLGSHCILNAFHGVDFGIANSIVPATSADIMHSFESGILKLVLSILLDPLGQADTNAIDGAVEETFGSCGPNRSGQFSRYPRVSFLRGFCSLTLLSSAERVGQLFVVALLLNTTRGKFLLSNRFSDNFDDDHQFPSSEEDQDGRALSEDDEEDAHPSVVPFYTRAEQTLLMRQLKLGFFVDSLHRLSSGHRNAAQALIGKVFTSRKSRFDRLLVAIDRDPSFEVLAGADLDYKAPFRQFHQEPTEDIPHHPLDLEWDVPTPMSPPPAIDPSQKTFSISLEQSQFQDLVELMLCFHASLKYGSDLFSGSTREKIIAYQTNFHRMMVYIRDCLKRPSGSNQFRIQKFLECCHFLQEHLFKGPPFAHNTDVGERGLKKWAKAPARTAQNRGDAVFKQQVAQNNHEAGLLNVVVSEFAPDLLPHRNKNVKGRGETVSVSGCSFAFLFRGEVKGFFKRSMCCKADLRQSEEVAFPGPIKQWFVSKFLLFFEQERSLDDSYEIVIPVFTEIVYSSGGERKQELRLRAHPNFYGRPWYDYAWIRYSFEEIDQGLYPARCACFFKLPAGVPIAIVNCITQVDAPESTVLVLVQECDYQTPLQQQHMSRICSKWTLQATNNQRDGTVVAKLKCMTHECVSEGLFAFDEDIDCSRHLLDPFTKRREQSGVRCSFDIVAVSNRQSEWTASFVSG
jgi:hypothetical protein